MAKVKIFEAGEHPAGFVGAAVRTTFNKKLVQHYFSFKLYNRKKALALAENTAKELTQKQKALAAHNILIKNRNGDSTLTKVRNITFSFHCSPCLRYQLLDKNKRAISTKTITFHSRAEYFKAYKDLVVFRANAENPAHKQDWIDHWLAKRPAWPKVKDYFFERYGYLEWR